MFSLPLNCCWKKRALKLSLLSLALFVLQGCASGGRADVFRDESMDFGTVKTVAILPFTNLSKDQLAAERVRDVLANGIMANSDLYALPPGEVMRGVISAGLASPNQPTPDEVIKFCRMTKSDAVITGILREYGEVRSGPASADVISLSVQMVEGQTGKVVWSATTTQGGVSTMDRLFGGGGNPLNVVTEKAVYEVINKLFQ